MGLVNRCECWVPVAQAFKGSAMALLRALGGEQLVTCGMHRLQSKRSHSLKFDTPNPERTSKPLKAPTHPS